MFSDVNTIFIIGVLVWLAVLTIFNLIFIFYYKRLVQGSDKKTIFELLSKLIKDREIDKSELKRNTVKLTELEKNALEHIQKVGLVRFNPFAETGGDQSFCLALLNGDGDGLVITSLHNRESTRVYAKPVKAGKESGYIFSEEEEKAIKLAKKLNK